MNNLNVSVNVKTKGERNLDRMLRKINNVQNQVRQAGDRAGFFSRKIVEATDRINGLNRANQKASKSAKKIGDNYGFATKMASKLGSKLKWLASVYLGVMGVKAMLNTSDTITRTKNQLNNLNGGNPTRTQETMDKVYAASMRSRSSYTDMLSNVGKTMTLAPEAFQNNENYAIRFQEIMAKSYALGNKSAAEQASSMYQLTQALGSGVLQGDELRSVNEGATVAYKKIEEFAQGIYKTKDSLKDLASEGKITSDIVVAAILDAGTEIDEMFENTNMTFANAMDQIKNTAVKSFEPALQMLNDALNSDFGQAILTGITRVIQILGGALTFVFTLIQNVYHFIVDNWGIISKVILTIATVALGCLIYYLILAIYTGSTLIATLVKGFILAGVHALAAGIKGAIGWMMMCPPLALIIALLAAIVIAAIWVGKSFSKVCAVMNGAMMGVGGVFTAVFTNIKLAFQNILLAMEYLFWKFVDGLITKFKPFLILINKALEAMGEKTIDLNFASNKASALSEQIGFVDVGDAWTAAYNKGYVQGDIWGQKVEDWVGDKISGIKGAISDKLGLGDMAALNDSINAPNTLGDGYDASKALGDIGDGVGDIGGNTGRIADSMELTKEDLEYLRKVADMEWKKEFTTANINVKMDNNIQSEADYEGFVTRLRNDMYEEMVMIADGAYVY